MAALALACGVDSGAAGVKQSLYTVTVTFPLLTLFENVIQVESFSGGASTYIVGTAVEARVTVMEKGGDTLPKKLLTTRTIVKLSPPSSSAPVGYDRGGVVIDRPSGSRGARV